MPSENRWWPTRCVNAGRRSDHSLGSPRLFFPRRHGCGEPAILCLQLLHFSGQGLESFVLSTLARFSPLHLLLELLEIRFRAPTLLLPLIPTPREKRHQLALWTLIDFGLYSGAGRLGLWRRCCHTGSLLRRSYPHRLPFSRSPSLSSAEQNWSPSPATLSSRNTYTFTRSVSAYIDARLADAHSLVKELPGPFDFVFSDADKEWYTQYFQELEPKLTVGGCFTAHNVLDGFAGAEAFLAYVQRHPRYTTTIDRTSRAGIAISCKTSE